MYLPKMEDSIGRNINDVCKRVADLETQFRDAGPLPKVKEKMRVVDADMACLSHQLGSLISEGGLKHKQVDMEDWLVHCKHALSDPTQLPRVVKKVTELLRTVNGTVDAHQGQVLTPDFTPAGGTIRRWVREEINVSRSECAWWLRQTVEEGMKNSQPGGLIWAKSECGTERADL